MNRSPKAFFGWKKAPLYPALHRMTQSGWLRAEWGARKQPPRAYLMPSPRPAAKQLAEEERSWAQRTEAGSSRMRFGLKRGCHEWLNRLSNYCAATS